MNITVLIIVLVIIVAAVGAWFFLQRQKSERLRTRFGPEYDRAVRETGHARKAEAELEAREKRLRELDIRPLSPEDARRFAEVWRRVQARFVDDPRGAVSEADGVVDEVMRARGYPIGDFDQRAADLSVNHARVVENYRAARQIAGRHARGEAGTEDLRQAMVHYRALFEDLLNGGVQPEQRAAPDPATRPEPPERPATRA
jgi:hypothetical protein